MNFDRPQKYESIPVEKKEETKNPSVINENRYVRRKTKSNDPSA